MKKFLEKSYTCLIYVFFALYVLLIRMDANDNKLIFYIGLILGSIVITIIPFFMNHCKKISVRRWYLICFTSLGAFITLQGLYFILADYVFLTNVNKYEVINNVFKWILIISQAIFLTSFIFMVIFTFKDYFKKDYCFEKFDLEAILMCLNSLAYIAIMYILFDFAGYRISQNLENNFVVSGNPYINFINDDIIYKGIGITSLIYIIFYVVIQVISYYKFEKNNDKNKDLYK